MPIIGLFANTTTGWAVMGSFMGAMILLSTFGTICSIREPIHNEVQPEEGFFKTFVTTQVSQADSSPEKLGRMSC